MHAFNLQRKDDRRIQKNDSYILPHLQAVIYVKRSRFWYGKIECNALLIGVFGSSCPEHRRSEEYLVGFLLGGVGNGVSM